jgi:erythromycin esterase-like protein
MGEGVSKKLKDDYYVIGFTACGGSYGASHLNIEKKNKAS